MRHVEPGSAIDLSADRVNRLAGALESGRLLSAEGDLELTPGAYGPALALPPDPCIWATLSGTTSPYSFTQSLPQSGGTFAAGPATGSANAYEANGTGSLSGKVVKICPGFPGDWRFYYRTRVTLTTITVTDACNGNPISGASTSVSGVDGLGDPLTISHTTDITGVASYDMVALGFANGTISWTAGATVGGANCLGTSGSFAYAGSPVHVATALSCNIITFTVQESCAGTAVSGVAATFVQGGTTLSGTTDASGHVSFRPATTGTWTLTLTKTGYVSYTTTASIACDLNAGKTIKIALSTDFTTTVTVNDCAGVNLNGATVTIVIGGQTWTGTTNSSGVVVFTGLPATTTGNITVSMGRYTTYNNTNLTASCSANTAYSVTLNGGSGFVATTGCPGVPIPQALTLTDPYGTVSVNNSGNCNNTIWINCATRSGTVVADNACIPGGTAQGFPIQYQFADDGTGGYTVTVRCPTCTLDGHPEGSVPCTSDTGTPPAAWAGTNFGVASTGGTATTGSCTSFVWSVSVTSLTIYGTSSPVTITVSG